MPTNPSLLIVPYRYKAAKLYSQLPESGAGDFTVTRSTTATRTNASGSIESVASGVPRIDYTGGGCPALLVEPAATNQIRNNTMVGAVAGTPGTIPTNWVVVNGAGLTRQVVGIGVESGVEYIDLRIFGTATGNFLLALDGANIITATSSQTWTHSAFLRVIAAPTPPTGYQLGAVFTNSGAYVNEAQVSVLPTSTLQRLSATFTTTSSAMNSLYPTFRAQLSNGQACDFTIRIGLPQMELGAVATSVIKTSGTMQTRNADVISVSSVSGLIGQTQGTLYLEIDLPNPNAPSARTIIELGAAPTRIYVAKEGPNNIFQLGTQSSAGYNFINTANQTAPVLKFAIAYASGNNAFYLNGTQIGNASAIANPTSLTSVLLGNPSGTNTPSRIRAVALYTTRLSNAELAQLTTL